MRDVILAAAAGAGSVTNLRRSTGYTIATSAYFLLLQQAWTLAQRVGIDTKVGNVFSGDFYYDPGENLTPALEKFGILGVGMEVVGLYALAHQFNTETLVILTVSDHYLIGEEIATEGRQLTFNNMIELTLNTAAIA